MQRPLTEKQQQILSYIDSFIKSKNFSPSLEELQKQFNISTKRGVVKHLIALEKKGFITKTSAPRSIRILRQQTREIPVHSSQTVSIPILGYANAGKPLVYAEEDIVGVIQVDREMIKKDNGLFALIVKGDSMNLKRLDKVPIIDSSYIIVDKNGEYRDGDVVLAVIDNAATIKTFRKSSNYIVLHPESNNPAHAPIYLNRDSDFVINGKVIAVLENPINSAY